MKRKNCRISANTPAQYTTGTCADNPAGRLRGTDPNRNYGGIWGGAGASTNWSDDTYRGDAPFSEPEIQNIRELQSTRSITNLITNHTFSNLVLRPPGVADFGAPLEEPQYKALGARMASHNGYANIPSYGLYDTTGGTEDWTFWTAGSLGFTFEIGTIGFHPPYNNGVVDEYLGRGQTAGSGKGGNREAYYEMLAVHRATQSLHSVIAGSAPSGSELKISKTVTTETSPVWNNDYGTDIGPVRTFQDTLEYSMKTDGSSFEWNVNPSTRPVVAGRDGRPATGPPQADLTFANPAGQPAENTGDQLAGAHEEFSFDVQGPPAVDNGRMTVHIDWANPDTDWDVYVYNAAGQLVTQSASFGDTTEDAILMDPPAGPLHRGDRQLRPGRRPALRRLGQRARGLREPAPADGDRRQGGLVDDLPPAGRQGDVAAGRRRRPRRAVRRQRGLRRGGGPQGLDAIRRAASGPPAGVSTDLDCRATGGRPWGGLGQWNSPREGENEQSPRSGAARMRARRGPHVPGRRVRPGRRAGHGLQGRRALVP